MKSLFDLSDANAPQVLTLILACYLIIFILGMWGYVMAYKRKLKKMKECKHLKWQYKTVALDRSVGIDSGVDHSSIVCTECKKSLGEVNF
jgi:hypothetical protein